MVAPGGGGAQQPDQGPAFLLCTADDIVRNHLFHLLLLDAGGEGQQSRTENTSMLHFPDGGQGVVPTPGQHGEQEESFHCDIDLLRSRPSDGDPVSFNSREFLHNFQTQLVHQKLVNGYNCKELNKQLDRLEVVFLDFLEQGLETPRTDEDVVYPGADAHQGQGGSEIQVGENVVQELIWQGEERHGGLEGGVDLQEVKLLLLHGSLGGRVPDSLVGSIVLFSLVNFRWFASSSLATKEKLSYNLSGPTFCYICEVGLTCMLHQSRKNR